jgi:branched-chain amino acid transport system permease protein
LLLPKRLAPVTLLAVAIVLPFILTGDYFGHLLVMTCIFGVLALGLDIIMGHMGQISLGHAAFFGIGAYTSALLSLRLGLSVWLSGFIAIVFVGILGFFIGYISLSRTRGVPFAIVTFGFGLALWLLCANWYDLTRGFSGISRIPPPVIAIAGLPKIEFKSPFSYYYLVLVCLIFTIYIIRRLLQCKFGRAIIALRENEDLACSVGVDPLRYTALAFALSAALAGFSGAAFAHFVRFITPNLLGMDYVFMMLIMVIVGGKGTIFGPVLGAAIFVLVPEGLRMVEQFRPVLIGMFFLVCIIFLPGGVYPGLVALWNHAFSSRKL